VKPSLLTLEMLEKGERKRNKSVGPEGVPGEILKLVGEVMTPYLARLLEISLKNANISRDAKIATVVPNYRGGYRLTL
jgi:hypothetical protein